MPHNHEEPGGEEQQVNYHMYCLPAPDGGCQVFSTGAVPIPPLSARSWTRAYQVDSPFERDACVDFLTPSYIAAFESGELEGFLAAATLMWLDISPSDILPGTPRQIFARYNGSVEAVEEAIREAKLMRQDFEEHLNSRLLWNARRGAVVKVYRRWQEELPNALEAYHHHHPYQLREACQPQTTQQCQREFVADLLRITTELFNPLPSPPSTPSPGEPCKPSYPVFTRMYKRRFPHRFGWEWLPNVVRDTQTDSRRKKKKPRRAKPTPVEQVLRWVQRGKRLFDKLTHTFQANDFGDDTAHFPKNAEWVMEHMQTKFSHIRTPEDLERLPETGRIRIRTHANTRRRDPGMPSLVLPLDAAISEEDCRTLEEDFRGMQKVNTVPLTDVLTLTGPNLPLYILGYGVCTVPSLWSLVTVDLGRWVVYSLRRLSRL
ncbi:hypothetical protein VKT23_010832 [Stygiomarasmius scandens]|uniref:Uncharacterized protein n=1 Tax=Marasmiellus scandens TaxID=2682957 RepID=A0ABR1JAC2_9AGAR